MTAHDCRGSRPCGHATYTVPIVRCPAVFRGLLARYLRTSSCDVPGDGKSINGL
jgi:hypothetical protein